MLLRYLLSFDSHISHGALCNAGLWCLMAQGLLMPQLEGWTGFSQQIGGDCAAQVLGILLLALSQWHSLYVKLCLQEIHIRRLCVKCHLEALSHYFACACASAYINLQPASR